MDEAVWYILRVKSRAEVSVAQFLTVPVYVPHRRVEYYNRRLRAKRVTFTPAFPGYVFCKTKTPQLIFLPDVAFGFLRNEDRSFACLSLKEFERLLDLEKAMRQPAAPQDTKTPRIEVGSTVRVKGGAWHPFYGLVGAVETHRNGRLVIRPMDQDKNIEISCSQVELVAGPLEDGYSPMKHAA